MTPAGVTRTQIKEVLQDEYEPAWFVKKAARSPAGRRRNSAGRPEEFEVFNAFRADLKGYVRLNPPSWRTYMSNATQRRERKLAKDLRHLAASNPARFTQ